MREIESREELLQDITKSRQNKILKINEDTQRFIREVSADKNTSTQIGGTLPLSQKIEGLFKLDRPITNKLNGEQILKMAEIQNEQARYVLDRVYQDRGYNVLVESIKKQLNLLHEERRKEIKRELKEEE